MDTDQATLADLYNERNNINIRIRDIESSIADKESSKYVNSYMKTVTPHSVNYQHIKVYDKKSRSYEYTDINIYDYMFSVSERKHSGLSMTHNRNEVFVTQKEFEDALTNATVNLALSLEDYKKWAKELIKEQQS